MNEFPKTCFSNCAICNRARQVIYLDAFEKGWAICIDCVINLATDHLKVKIAMNIAEGKNDTTKM